MVRAVNERLQTLGPSFIEIGLILTSKLTGTKNEYSPRWEVSRVRNEPPMAEWCNGSISESLSDDPSSSLGAASAAMPCRVVMSLLNLHKRYHGFSHFKLPPTEYVGLWNRHIRYVA